MYEKAFVMSFFLSCSISLCRNTFSKKVQAGQSFSNNIAAYLLWVDTSAAMSEWWPIVFLCWCWHNIHVLECTLLILAHIHNSISSSLVLLSCWVDSEAEKLTGWHVSVLRFNSTQVFVLEKVGTVISSIFWPFSPTQKTKNGIYQHHDLFIL